MAWPRCRSRFARDAYSLSRQGEELVGMLDAAHREGIRAYVDQLRRRLVEAFTKAR